MASQPNLSSPGNRFRWLDQFRGAAIFYLMACNLIHWPHGNQLLDLFFSHADRRSNLMTFRDINTCTFIFIMGFLYGYMFLRYRQKHGLAKATRRIFLRYGLILMLGMLSSYVGTGAIVKERTAAAGVTITVVVWDVLQTIGLAGLLGYPFLFLKPAWRMAGGYSMLIFYQLMLSFEGTGWRDFAINSVHGGILGAIFSFSAQLIIASALGEFYFARAARSRAETFKTFIWFGALNLAVGIVCAASPDLGVSKRQVALGYSAICIGAAVLVANIFVWLEIKNQLFYFLDALGKNPFLLYLGTLGCEALMFNSILKDQPIWVQMSAGFLSLGLFSYFAVVVYTKIGIIKTETTALIALAIIGLMAIY